jgi:phage gp16-like protein
MSTGSDPTRNKDLARIHIAVHELGLDDETYRDLLRSTTGKGSAGELDARERWRVLVALSKAGAKSAARYPGRPAQQRPGKEALLGKVEALLADAKRPWAYAHAMARRMFKVDQVQWCDADQLHRLVAALEYDQRRREG